MPRNWSRQTSLWFPRRLSVPSSETRNTVDLAPRAPSCHKLRLASAHTPSKSVSGFLACAEPTASASWPAHRSRAARPDTPANPALCSSPPLASCRVYPESPRIKTPIPSAAVTVSRSEPLILDQVMNDEREPAVGGVLRLARFAQSLIGVSSDLDNLASVYTIRLHQSPRRFRSIDG